MNIFLVLPKSNSNDANIIPLPQLVISEKSYGLQRFLSPHMTFQSTFFEVSVVSSPKYLSLSGVFAIDKNLKSLENLMSLVFDPYVKNQLPYSKLIITSDESKNKDRAYEIGAIRNISIIWNARLFQYVNISMNVVATTMPITYPVEQLKQIEQQHVGSPQILEAFISESPTKIEVYQGNSVKEFQDIITEEISFSVDMNIMEIPTNKGIYIQTFNVNPIQIALNLDLPVTSELPAVLKDSDKVVIIKQPAMFEMMVNNTSVSRTGSLKNYMLCNLSGHLIGKQFKRLS